MSKLEKADRRLGRNIEFWDERKRRREERLQIKKEIKKGE